MAKVVDSLGHVQATMDGYLYKVDANENTVPIDATTTNAVPEAVEVEIVELPDDSMKDSQADSRAEKDSDDCTVSD